MRLILSRKGFDSSEGGGGCPSPIFPDGTMIALPIPDERSPIRYAHLNWRGRNLGRIVEALTGWRIRRGFGAHLDPDLRRDIVGRREGWQPSLGQVGSAQGHLRKQGVSPGDLFLFWGLFRPVDKDWRWLGPADHRIWGWMQIGEIVPVDTVVRTGGSWWDWTARHPHLQYGEDPSNTLYLAAHRLRVPGACRVAGAGVFEHAEDRHRLTAPGQRPSSWRLPEAFWPPGGLTFHQDKGRWRRDGDHVLLRTVRRGQEFVLNLDEYPGVLRWIAQIVAPS